MSTIPDEVVRRYAFKHDIAISESLKLFDDLESFLDMAAVRSVSPSEHIDSAWHEFILHTKIYADFCLYRYGRLVHHIPSSPLAGETYEDHQRNVKCSSRCSSGGGDPFRGSAKCESEPCASDCRSCKSQEYELS